MAIIRKIYILSLVLRPCTHFAGGIWKWMFLFPVRRLVHTNLLRKLSFLKTFFSQRNLKMSGLHFGWMEKKTLKQSFSRSNVAIVVILLRSSFIQTQMQNGFCFVKFLWHPVDKIFDALWFSNFVTRCKWHLNIQGLCSSIHEESVAVCEKHCFYFWQGGKKVVGVKAPWVTAASLGLCFLCGTIDLWLYITQDKLGEGTYRKSLFEGCPSFKQWFRICIILTLE